MLKVSRSQYESQITRSSRVLSNFKNLVDIGFCKNLILY